MEHPSLNQEWTPPYLMLTLRQRDEQLARLIYKEGRLIVGRGEHCGLVLPFPWISLQHLELRWSLNGISARDLHSKTPALCGWRAIDPNWTEPSTQLTLALPEISLDCELSWNQAAQSQDHEARARLRRHLWRQESGWIAWISCEVDHPVKCIQYSGSDGLDYPASRWQGHWSAGSWPEKKISGEATQVYGGMYWFLGREGEYELRIQSGLHQGLIELRVSADNILIQGGPIHTQRRMCSSGIEYRVSCLGSTFIFNRKGSPPTLK